jgi:hypothetical protein
MGDKKGKMAKETNMDSSEFTRDLQYRRLKSVPLALLIASYSLSLL